MSRQFAGYARSLLEFQIVVFGSLLVVGAALTLARPNGFDPMVFAAGAALIVLTTAATVLWHRNAQFQRFSLLVPLVDIVGIRLTALADESVPSGGALLLVLPVIWIAYTFGLWGLAACLSLLVVTSPPGYIAGYATFDSEDFTHLVAVPLTLLIVAGAAAESGRRMRRKRVELAEQTALTERAVRARDDLIAAVTHELRTPLTSILGNAELVLRASEQPQTVQRRAGVIVRNSQQMEAILDDLLLARSTTTATLSMHPATTDIRELVDHAVAASRALAESRSVTIDVAVRESLWAEVDPQRIRQVLDNLLTNSIKYNREGGTVTVSEAHSPGTVTLAVTDCGDGIAPGERVRVFEPYYRTDAARRSPQKGTGLGLGISRDIARRHGGDLRIAESSSTGSRFELSLPLAPGTGAALG